MLFVLRIRAFAKAASERQVGGVRSTTKLRFVAKVANIHFIAVFSSLVLREVEVLFVVASLNLYGGGRSVQILRLWPSSCKSLGAGHRLEAIPRGASRF